MRHRPKFLLVRPVPRATVRWHDGGMTAAPHRTGDRLARVLHSLRMRSTFYCHAEVREPWALEMPAIADSISFHVPTSGVCWLALPDADPIELRPGDLALVPHGRGHDLLSSPEAGPSARVDLLPQHYLSPQYSTLRHGDDGRVTDLICGIVAFDDPAARELMGALPASLVVGDGSVTATAAIRDTLRLMAGELSRPQFGGEAVASRLADVLVVQAIRSWLAHDAAGDGTAGWLSALQDERIGRAIEAMHDDPGAEWTLDGLARVATMSRSAFSARFTGLVGESPIAYLTRWRMNVARARLSEGDTTAAQLAGELGYRSEAAFHRAFTRATGSTPGSVRTQGRGS